MNDKNIIQRNYYVDQIVASIGTPVIKVISGMRRVGKTSIMQSVIDHLIERGEIASSSVFVLNKELPEFWDVRDAGSLYDILIPFFATQTGRCIIAIDEIQEISGWEQVVSGILAQYGDRCDIIITGSNSHLLGGDLATLIAGRYIVFQIFPLSWEEYLEFTGQPHSRVSFLEFMEYGGLPGIHVFPVGSPLRMSYLRSVYESIVLRDIVERFQIRGFDFLRNLYHYTCGNIGHIVSAQSIARYLRNQRLTVSVDSIIQYLSYGVHTYIFDRVGSVDPTTKKVFEIYNKYYIGDIGLRNAIVGYMPSRDIAVILENIVFLLFRKYGYDICIGRIDDMEVDFIVSRGLYRYYLQVATSLSDEATRRREYKSLDGIDDSFPKYVVHLDEIDWGVTDTGIRHISILDLENTIVEDRL